MSRGNRCGEVGVSGRVRQREAAGVHRLRLARAASAPTPAGKDSVAHNSDLQLRRQVACGIRRCGIHLFCRPPSARAGPVAKDDLLRHLTPATAPRVGVHDMRRPSGVGNERRWSLSRRSGSVATRLWLELRPGRRLQS